MKQKTITIREEFPIPGTDIILEAGDEVKVLRESSLGVPYDLVVDYYIDQGKKISVVQNKSGAMSGSLIIEEGTSYEIDDLYEFGQGAISFLVEAYDTNYNTSVYSWVTYDSKREAMKDGWRL